MALCKDLPTSESLTDCDLNYSDNIYELFSMVANTSAIMNQQRTIVLLNLF